MPNLHENTEKIKNILLNGGNYLVKRQRKEKLSNKCFLKYCN
ncbi:hypothetical protein Xen7305DRAFT_00019490 [Xenococcus sp. PCC 7305]|nr:hypothetical protein Xen7305DRAFT_00019490 [Xenococcus sp. PCC 7305]